MSRILTLLLIATIVTPCVLYAGEAERDALFRIERSKNANIVQYDAQLGANGMLDAREPIVGYWVRLAEQGQVKELTWVQRTFAYGFTAKLNKKDNTATLNMAADFAPTLLVKRVGDDYRAIADINGEPSYLDRIFVQASGKGISVNIEYIELYGTAVNSSTEQYQRFSP